MCLAKTLNWPGLKISEGDLTFQVMRYVSALRSLSKLILHPLIYTSTPRDHSALCGGVCEVARVEMYVIHAPGRHFRLQVVTLSLRIGIMQVGSSYLKL
jgi:hypothetical protein